jgi:ferredoxin
MHEFTITDNTSKQTFVCRDDEYVLYAMQLIGKKFIPIGCKGGGCGICRINIISGKVNYGCMSKAHVTVEEKNNGYALACRIKPKSDLVIECASKTNTSIGEEVQINTQLNENEVSK